MFFGSPAKALPYIERAIEIGRSQASIGSRYYAIGACFQSLGHEREALAWLLKARASNPDLGYVRSRLAAVYGQLGEIEQARNELEAAYSFGLSGVAKTITQIRAHPQGRHPDYIALSEATYYVGLRKAGMADA